MKNRTSVSMLKRLVPFALLMGLLLITLSSCYVEPDRITDPSTDIGTGTQTFESVITPTPTVPVMTPTPTVAPTTYEVDWSQWNFGTDNATNPPSNVVPTQNSSVVTVTVPPSVVQSTTAGVTTATPKPSTVTSTSSPTSTFEVLKLGSKGDNVKRLQQQLKNLGYYTGSVDGTFGSGTETAVKNFQANNGLTADGVAGQRTQQLLYSGNAKKYTATSVTAKPATTTKKPSATATPKPTTNTATAYTNGKKDIYLQVGSSNASQVKILQNRLIVLGYLSGTADGVYGDTTAAAVKAFQDRNGLYADGIAGPSTLEKLYSSSAKKANAVVAHLGSLREGMNGDAVRTLQKNLRTLGYYKGTVDGDYGAATTAAVKSFQLAQGLTADGVAGKSTLNAIQNALSGGSSSSSTSKTSPENYGKTASSNGYTSLCSDNGSKSNVTALQSALKATGYYSGTVDGSYGGGTEEAVKKYQRAAGLRVTGIAGPSTQRLLYGGTSESGTYTKLKLGSSGSAVKRLQYALYELKYYDGDISGNFDAATESAVMAFQQVNGLTIDGVAGQDTQRRLFSSNAVPSNI